MILSGAQRNLTIVFLYKCSPYTSNINVQNHHSFWSYDKNFLSLNPKYEKNHYICGVVGVSYVEPRVAKISGA